MEEMQMPLKLDDAYFHDAVLGDIRYSVARRELDVNLSMYDSSDSAGRNPRTLSFRAATHALVNLDFPQLADYASGGNVQDRSACTARNITWMYLTGGLVECGSDEVLLTSGVTGQPIPKRADAETVTESWKRFCNLDFHGAILDEVLISPQSSTCSLALQMCETSGSYERTPVLVTLRGCRSCLLTLDGASLAEPGKFGNVSIAHVGPKRGIAWFYLQHGLIEVSAKSVSVVRAV